MGLVSYHSHLISLNQARFSRCQRRGKNQRAIPPMTHQDIRHVFNERWVFTTHATPLAGNVQNPKMPYPASYAEALGRGPPAPGGSSWRSCHTEEKVPPGQTIAARGRAQLPTCPRSHPTGQTNIVAPTHLQMRAVSAARETGLQLGPLGPRPQLSPQGLPQMHEVPPPPLFQLLLNQQAPWRFPP